MTAIANHSMTALEWLLLVSLSVLWGGSFFFTGIAVQELPPLTIVVLRVGLAAVILHLVIGATGLRVPWDRQAWIAFFWMGLLNNAIPFSLIVWGQTYIASGLASILNATTPLWTVVAAHFLITDEKMTLNRGVGVTVGFVGVIILLGPAVLTGLGAEPLAQVAVVGAALSYALAGIFGRRFVRMGIAPMVTAAGQITASTILLIPVTVFVDRPWNLAFPSPSAWGAIIGMAVLSTALAYILYFRLLATAGAVNLLLVTFFIPVSAIVLGAMVLGEQLDPKHFMGMGLIGLGLAYIDGRLLKTRHLRNPARPEARSGSATGVPHER